MKATLCEHVSKQQPGGSWADEGSCQSIVKALVDDSDEVSVTELHGHSTTIIEQSVAKEDLGKVIGKRGRTINAIRTVLNAAGTARKKRVILEVAG